VDLQKLIQALEEFVYEVALLPLLLPKTLFRFAFRPKRIHDYVNAELDKPAGERYAEYLSPILYWLLIAIAPAFFMINRSLRVTTDSLGSDIYQEPVEVRLSIIIIFLIWPPLSFTLGAILRQNIKLTRETARRPFYKRCMNLAPLYLVLVFAAPSMLGLLETNRPAHAPLTAIQLAWIGFFAAFIWAIDALEKRIIRLEPKGRSGIKLIASSVLAWICAFALLFLLEIAGVSLAVIFSHHR
jgi:hypothetical protein